MHLPGPHARSPWTQICVIVLAAIAIATLVLIPNWGNLVTAARPLEVGSTYSDGRNTLTVETVWQGITSYQGQVAPPNGQLVAVDFRFTGGGMTDLSTATVTDGTRRWPIAPAMPNLYRNAYRGENGAVTELFVVAPGARITAVDYVVGVRTIRFEVSRLGTDN